MLDGNGLSLTALQIRSKSLITFHSSFVFVLNYHPRSFSECLSFSSLWITVLLGSLLHPIFSHLDIKAVLKLSLIMITLLITSIFWISPPLFLCLFLLLDLHSRMFSFLLLFGSSRSLPPFASVYFSLLTCTFAISLSYCCFSHLDLFLLCLSLFLSFDLYLRILSLLLLFLSSGSLPSTPSWPVPS